MLLVNHGLGATERYKKRLLHAGDIIISSEEFRKVSNYLEEHCLLIGGESARQVPNRAYIHPIGIYVEMGFSNRTVEVPNFDRIELYRELNHIYTLVELAGLPLRKGF